jgi:hypothetical protein
LEPVDRPTVLLELPADVVDTLSQAVVQRIGGSELRGLVIVAETDVAVGIAAADWLPPEVQADMIRVAHQVVVRGF